MSLILTSTIESLRFPLSFLLYQFFFLWAYPPVNLPFVVFLPSSYRRMEYTSSGTGLMIEPGNFKTKNLVYFLCYLQCCYTYFAVSFDFRYPLGRVIGGTVYPGLTLTAGTIWW